MNKHLIITSEELEMITSEQHVGIYTCFLKTKTKIPACVRAKMKLQIGGTKMRRNSELMNLVQIYTNRVQYVVMMLKLKNCFCLGNGKKRI